MHGEVGRYVLHLSVAPVIRPREGFVVRSGTHFYIDADGDHEWTTAADSPPFYSDPTFKLGGVDVVSFPIVGDFDGNGLNQVALLTDTKARMESGDFYYRPSSSTCDYERFFAPNQGILGAAVGDWNLDGADDWVKAADGMRLFVDRNGNKRWDGGEADAKFRIQGGIPGKLFVIDLGEGPAIGVMTSSKVFIDANRDYKWRPGKGDEVVSFFAPNHGAIKSVLIGDWDGDGLDNIGKVNESNEIFLDFNGDFRFDSEVDKRFCIGSCDEAGMHFAGALGMNGEDSVGKLSEREMRIDANANHAWDPENGDEVKPFWLWGLDRVGAFVGIGHFQDP
jgi:hypothetical protein